MLSIHFLLLPENSLHSLDLVLHIKLLFKTGEIANTDYSVPSAYLCLSRVWGRGFQNGQQTFGDRMNFPAMCNLPYCPYASKKPRTPNRSML